MSTPRILVGSPTTSAKHYALALYAWTARHLSHPLYDVLMVDNSDDEGDYAQLMRDIGLPTIRTPREATPYDSLARARNALREKAIEGEYDYLLMLESDVFAPLDVIERLLAHGKPYVTTVQWNCGINPQTRALYRYPALCRKLPEEKTLQEVKRGGITYKVVRHYDTLTDDDVHAAPLIEVDRSHLGCALIHTSLLRDVRFRHEGQMTGDYCFSDDLRANGVRLYCDTTIPLVHVSEGKTHAQPFLKTPQ